MERSTLRIAWRNLGRNRWRTALTVMAIGVGQFALLATSAIMLGYADNIRRAVTGPLVGHVQLHAPEWREDRAIDQEIVDVAPRVAVIEAHAEVANAAPRLYAPVLTAPVQDAFSAIVVGVDVARESVDFGMLSGNREALRPMHVLLGYRLARRMQTEVGQEIAIIGQAPNGALANDLYIVQEIIRSPVDLVNQTGIVMRLEDAQELFYMPGAAHEIVVRARRSGIARELAARLAADPGLAGLEVTPWMEVVPEFELMLRMSDFVGLVVLLLVFVAAIAGIANTLMMSTFERSHELGMLLALGCTPRRLRRMIMAEAMLIGVVGVVAGTVAGYLFVLLTQGGGIDFAMWGRAEVQDLAIKGLNLPLHVHPRMDWRNALIGLFAILLTSLVASLWPAALASRLEPVEAMRA